MIRKNVVRGFFLVAAFGLALTVIGCKGKAEPASAGKAEGGAPSAVSSVTAVPAVQAVQRPEISIEHCSG